MVLAVFQVLQALAVYQEPQEHQELVGLVELLELAVFQEYLVSQELAVSLVFRAFLEQQERVEFRELDGLQPLMFWLLLLVELSQFPSLIQWSKSPTILLRPLQ